MPDEGRADDPREWLRRARSNLEMARAGGRLRGVSLEEPCFEAQQAAEKAVKAALIHIGVRFPYVHDLAELLSLVEKAGEAVPEDLKEAGGLTPFALEARYPGTSGPVTRDEYDQAVAIAERVVAWAEERLRSGGAAV